MYAHRVIQPLNGLRLQLDLPPEFIGCQEAEIIRHYQKLTVLKAEVR